METELEALCRSRFQALVARDASTLKKYYSPDFQAVGPDGEPVGLSFLEGIMRAAPKDFAIEPFAFRFLVSADGSQGVVFHKSHDVWGGQKSDVAYTEVYERREGRWRLRFEQYAELQAPAPAAPSTGKRPVTSAADLPRRDYPLPKGVKPSEIPFAPDAVFNAFAAPVRRDLAADLAGFDIQDKTTRQGLLQGQLALAVLEGDVPTGRRLIAEVRALEEKPDGRLVASLSAEIVLDAREVAGPGADDAAIRAAIPAALEKRVAALPFAAVADRLKTVKAGLEVGNANLLAGSLQASLDPAAAAGTIGGDAARSLLSARTNVRFLYPVKTEAAAVLTRAFAAHTVVKPDRWTGRTVALDPKTDRLTPTTLAVWDTGVDVNLFAAQLAKGPDGQPGIAYDLAGARTPELLTPLGPVAGRWTELSKQLKGALDLQANVDSPDAGEFKRFMGGLQPAQVKDTLEALGLASNHAHGSLVTTIALAGNPAARLLVGRYSLSNEYRTVPPVPTAADSARRAAEYRETVAYFQRAGARVVNMSWRYGPEVFEEMLAANNVGKDGPDRQRMARELFAVEREGLRAAIASAPEILFVAGSGNEDNDASFDEYIPAGLTLPNLLTAGAVDGAGEEASFSSFGPTVAVHANGFELEGLIPGGGTLKASGTSFAAPQVANLAAKLFALDPKLTVAECRDLILKPAERTGRVNLLFPKRSVELLRPRLTASPGGR